MALSTKQASGDRPAHHVTPHKEGEHARPGASRPLTAMIDVTFLLLLFFLLTFTFRQAEGLIPGTLPGGRCGKGILSAIVIDVVPPPGPFDADAGVFFIENDRFDSAESLYRELERRKAYLQSTEQPIEIKPAPGVRWQHVVDAFSQGVRAKYETISFAAWSLPPHRDRAVPPTSRVV